MPLPRYQPVRKKPKVGTISPEDLDDYCLSKIIGHALVLSSQRSDGTRLGENGRTERNLSLVSKRWYFLTQCQVTTYGVHRIQLDKISREALPSRLKYGSVTKRPRTLMQSTITNNSLTINRLAQQQQHETTSLNNNNLQLFNSIRSKLFKYKHIQIDGFLTCDEFKKLIVALDAARVETLDLRIKIEKDGTLMKGFSTLPRTLKHLQRLTLFWFNDIKNDFSNGLTWTLYERATHLESLEIHLNDELGYSFDKVIEQSKGNAIETIANKYFVTRNKKHSYLKKFVFKRNSPTEPTDDCSYTALCKSILAKEGTLQDMETNDQMLISHLIKSSQRTCTSHQLKSLKFLASLNGDLLSLLFGNGRLGTSLLSIVVDDVDQIELIRHLMEDFKESRRAELAVCQLNIYLKDQKFSDFEDKIKNLTHLCRLATVTIHISVQQRVSIDCCHLMWSIGRALQPNDSTGNCLFKISLQNAPKQLGGQNHSEITVPFGQCRQYRINDREDMARHKEIIKSLKKECYHMFVKSVRDNVVQ